MFEIALRAAGRAHDPDEHQAAHRRCGPRFGEVAAGNPNAWIQRAYTADEIRTAGPDNRMIGFPYTKLMNSNNDVEQGAGLILCSVERAEALGVPRDRWVFPHVRHRRPRPLVRVEPGRSLASPGHPPRRPGRVELAGQHRRRRARPRRPVLVLPVRGPDRCRGARARPRPAADRHRRHELRRRSVEQLRDARHRHHGRPAPRRPRRVGLCTANGGFATKHAFGIYRTEPRRSGFTYEHADPQDRGRRAPARRELADDHAGPVTVEAYTVMHDRDDDPEPALVAVLTPTGFASGAAAPTPRRRPNCTPGSWVAPHGRE